MTQNRKKTIDLFAGNLSNAIVHEILEIAIKEDEGLSQRYRKELLSSFEIAKKYRTKINPKDASLPEKDSELIFSKITQKVTSELKARIKKGYENINLELVEEYVKKNLQKLNV